MNGHRSILAAGGLLIWLFTAQPQAPAFARAGACGWAVNEKLFQLTQSTAR
jgi:hypothetical protein